MKSCRTLTCLMTMMFLASCLVAQENGPLTKTEQLVLRELKAGKVAELGKLAPDDRVLGPEFVEKLVTDGYPDPEIQRRGVALSHARFKTQLKVSSENVPFRMWLNNCVFENGIDLSYTSFARDLSLEGSVFQNKSTPKNKSPQAYFAGIRVAGEVNFSSTEFDVLADFTHAEFDSNLLFNNVTYRATEAADFQLLVAKGPVSFEEDSFDGRLSLSDSDLLQLVIVHPHSALELDLSQAQIKRGTQITKVQLKSWQAASLFAQGPVRLDGVESIGPVNLAHAHLGNLFIVGFKNWLSLKPGMLNLEGFSFDTLDIGDMTAEPEPHAAKLLELLDSESSPFSPQPYLELERFLRAHGNVQEADKVYVHMRRKQRHQLSWINKAWDWLVDVALGYGRETWRSVLCAILITLVGAFIFAPDRMEWTNPERKPGEYNRFWYSLDDFAPVIDLGEAKNWGLIDDQRWVRAYARFHRVSGWILLPLVVAAITGIVK